MSTQWAQFFAESQWDGAGWGLGFYTDRSTPTLPPLGPSDQILHVLCNILRDDSTLDAIFGRDHIEVMEMRPEADFTNPPRRLYLYSGTIDQEYQTTAADVKQIAIYLGVAFLLQNIVRVPDGEATVASVLDYVEFVVKSNKSLVVATSATNNVSLSEDLIIQPYETLHVIDKTGRPYGRMQEIQATFQVVTDRDNDGRIRPLVTAGV